MEALTKLTAFRGFAGTSILIIVGVATDTARKVSALRALFARTPLTKTDRKLATPVLAPGAALQRWKGLLEGLVCCGQNWVLNQGGVLGGTLGGRREGRPSEREGGAAGV